MKTKSKKGQKISPNLIQTPIERTAKKGEGANPLKFHPLKRPKEQVTDRGTFGFK